MRPGVGVSHVVQLAETCWGDSRLALLQVDVTISFCRHTLIWWGLTGLHPPLGTQALVEVGIFENESRMDGGDVAAQVSRHRIFESPNHLVAINKARRQELFGMLDGDTDVNRGASISDTVVWYASLGQPPLDLFGGPRSRQQQRLGFFAGQMLAVTPTGWV